MNLIGQPVIKFFEALELGNSDFFYNDVENLNKTIIYACDTTQAIKNKNDSKMKLFYAATVFDHTTNKYYNLRLCAGMLESYHYSNLFANRPVSSQFIPLFHNQRTAKPFSSDIVLIHQMSQCRQIDDIINYCKTLFQENALALTVEYLLNEYWFLFYIQLFEEFQIYICEQYCEIKRLSTHDCPQLVAKLANKICDSMSTQKALFGSSLKV